MGTQIHSVKHIIDANGVNTGGVKSVVPLTKVVNARTEPFDPVELVVGETVNAMFIEVFMIGSSGTGVDQPQNWYICKARAGQDLIADFPTPSSTGTSEFRSQIFHEEKGLVGSADGSQMIFKGVIVIPKGMRRQRAGDQFAIELHNQDPANDSNFCVKAIFKSFS